MEVYVVIYDNDEDWAKHCSMVIRAIAHDMNFASEISIYTKADDVLHNYRENERAPGMFCLPMDAGSDGLNVARALRENGYGGGILFLADGYEGIMDTLEISPSACIQKKRVDTEQFRAALLRCLFGVKMEEAHLIQCRLQGHIIGVPLGHFSSFYKDGEIIWGETQEGIGQVYLAWERVVKEAEHNDYLSVSSTRIVHIRTIGQVAQDKIVLCNQEIYPLDRHLHEMAIKAFYRYLNRDFPQRKRGIYECNGA